MQANAGERRFEFVTIYDSDHGVMISNSLNRLRTILRVMNCEFQKHSNFSAKYARKTV